MFSGGRGFASGAHADDLAVNLSSTSLSLFGFRLLLVELFLLSIGQPDLR